LFAIAACSVDLAPKPGPDPPGAISCNSCHLPTGEPFMQQVILREIIRIEKLRPTAASDAGGHVDPDVQANWVEHCTRRAQVLEMGVREQQSPDNNEIKTLTVIRVKLRWDAIAAATNGKMRGNWLNAIGGARRLNIQGVYDPDGDRRQLFVECLSPTS